MKGIHKYYILYFIMSKKTNVFYDVAKEYGQNAVDLAKDITKMNNNVKINLYINDSDIKLTKRFLFLFDIYIFIKSILSCPSSFPVDLYEQFKNSYSETHHSEAFLDFFVIYTMLRHIPIKRTIENTIDASYKLIISELSITPTNDFDDDFMNHVIEIHNIIAINIRVNLHSSRTLSVDNVFNVLEKITDSDEVESIYSDTQKDSQNTINEFGKRCRPS